MTPLVAVSIGLALVSSALLIYPYLIYPLVLRTLPRRALAPAPLERQDGSRFSLLFCAHNEALALPSKLANIEALKDRYPKLEVLAYDDASTDGTPTMLDECRPQIVVVHGHARTGKAQGMRELVKRAETEFLIFTDANVTLELDAIDQFASYFSDEQVGGVCGVLNYVGDHLSATASVGGAYWRLEELTKMLESRTGNVMGADGSIFSMRRRLYPNVDNNALDDLTASMAVVFGGLRLIRAPEVRAYEKLVSNRAEEFQRKMRIGQRAYYTHRILRSDLENMSLLDRFKYFSHKQLRWFGGLFLLVAAVSMVLAIGSLNPYLAPAIVIAGFATYAWARAFPNGHLNAAIEACLAILATQLGVVKACRGMAKAMWEPAQSRC